MSEYIVDRETGDITYVAGAPIPFSISGKYVVNVPGYLQVFPETDSVTDIVNQKIDGFKALHPVLSNEINDELISSPNVDNAESSGFMVGIDKRTAILPGGSIVTNQINIVSPVATLFSHWNGFTLTSVPSTDPNPGPDRLLYNFDTVSGLFIQFQSSTFTVDIRDSANTVTISSLLFGQEQSIALAAGNYRLRFTNNSPDTIFFLSDWLILHD